MSWLTKLRFWFWKRREQRRYAPGVEPPQMRLIKTAKGVGILIGSRWPKGPTSP